MAVRRSKFAGSPFEPLQLTPLDVDKLQQLTDVFVHTNALALEQLSVVDERVWKLVKQREDVRVYAERTRRSSSNKDSGADTKKLPTMLVLGSVEGSLDDVMYGVVNHSLEAMRIKSSYVGDNVSDAAVLATLVAPSVASPFESLTIKWMENEQARMYRPVVRNRDFVYMETTGFARTPAGERVGYHLLHSVHLPQTHELTARVRGNMSVCGLYRERGGGLPGSHHVNVFVRGVLNPGGRILQSIVVRASADALVSARHNVTCAQMKKLTWMLRSTPRWFSGSTAESSSSHSEGSRPHHVPSDRVDTCVLCNKAQSSVSQVLRDVLRTRQCHLCGYPVCAECRVKKVLSHVKLPADKLRRREFTFCATCVCGAMRASALQIAQRELGGSSASDSTDWFATNQLEHVLEPADQQKQQEQQESETGSDLCNESWFSP